MFERDLVSEQISFLETIQSALARYREITILIAEADTRGDALQGIQTAFGCDEITLASFWNCGGSN